MAVKPKRRPGRPSTGARERVVAAARELFLEHEYDEVSTEQILARSGVSRGALYHHFPTKLELFRAVYEASERGVLERVAAKAIAATDPFEALLAAASAYLKLAESDEELRRIGLTQSRAVLGWSGWRQAATDLGIGVVRAMVSAAIDAGQLKPHDPDTTAQVLLGALIEAAMLIVVADDPAKARQQSEAVIGDLLSGLRTTG
ncbi:MAG TPA: TetR/AcrR family transcriptional regulator [Solirubrobacterales bacterium]|nr:TetR/AcrR family transcriptional regulator [Solirubrobacterales bacterium]